MKNKTAIKGKVGGFWLFSLVLIILLGIYLLNDGTTDGAVQVFGNGAYAAPNRSFTDLLR